MTPAPPPQPYPQQQPYPPQPYPQQQPYPPQPGAPGTYPPAPMYQAQQPMYAPPPMYMAPPPQPGAKTFEGLKWLRYGALLALVYNLIGALGGILIVTALGSSGPLTNPNAVLASLGAALAVAAGAGIVGFIGFILGVMGLYNLSKGKFEFGPAHQASVEKGNRFLLFAIVVSIVGGVVAALVAVVIGFNTGFGGFNVGAFQTYLLVVAALSGVVAIVSTYLLAIALESYLERLMTASGRALRNNFVLFSVIGAGVGLGLGVVGALMFSSSLANPLTASTTASLAPLAGLVSVLTMFWYKKQVEDAVKGCQTMIASGVLNPDGGPVPAMPVAAIAQAPAYPMQPPPPYQPPPPPPPAGP